MRADDVDPEVLRPPFEHAFEQQPRAGRAHDDGERQQAAGDDVTTAQDHGLASGRQSAQRPAERSERHGARRFDQHQHGASRLRGPAQKRPTGDVGANDSQLGHPRREQFQHRQAVVHGAVVDRHDLEIEPQRAQMIRHGPNLVAYQFLVVANGQDDRNFGASAKVTRHISLPA